MSPQTEAEISQMHAVKTVEAMLRGLLEKAQRASDMISTLRAENRRLGARVGELERELMELRRELSARTEELHQQEARGDEARSQAASNGFLSPPERDLMREKLKDLLARISQYV